MVTTIVYGKYVIIDADTVIPSGALYIENDKVIDYGSHKDITSRYKADRTLGSAEMLVMPGLVNAHSHGKGLTDFQRGQTDDTLETWKWRNYPPIDPYLDTKWACVNLLESGVTTTMHNHGLIYPESYEKEFVSVLNAYKEGGVRVALAPTLNTENVFTYGDDIDFINSLPSELKTTCHTIMKRMDLFGEKEYFDSVEALHKSYTSSYVRIMHGPPSPQWVRTEALQEIRKQADELGIRIHTHVQQTPLQKLYGFKRYGKSLIAYLADLDFLGNDVTCGHSVWISDEDIDILAQTGASVTHHPSCNLRVRNGISPVYELLNRGVTVAIGMDDKEMGDDKDYLAEMRIALRLHQVSGQELDSPRLMPKDVFRMGTAYGAEVLGMDSWIGTLERGKQADILLLDMEMLTEPYIMEDHDPVDILLYRGKAKHIHTVIVGGKILLREGKLTRINRKEVIAKLRESLPSDYHERFRKLNKDFVRLRAFIKKHYKAWYNEIDLWDKNPYYFMNNRN